MRDTTHRPTSLTGSGQGHGTDAQPKERCGEHRATRQRRRRPGGRRRPLRRGAARVRRAVRPRTSRGSRRTLPKGAGRRGGVRCRSDPEAPRLSLMSRLSLTRRLADVEASPLPRLPARRRPDADGDAPSVADDTAETSAAEPETPEADRAGRGPGRSPPPPPPRRSRRRVRLRRRPAPVAAPARGRRLRRRRRAAGRRWRGLPRRHRVRRVRRRTTSGAAGDDTPPPLALDGYSRERRAWNGIAPGEPNPYGATYRVDGTLPGGPASAPVFRSAGKVSEERGGRGWRRRSASTGRRWRQGQAWQVGAKDGSGPSLQVNRQAPGAWTFHRYAPGTG